MLFITGATGFIGYHLIKTLRQREIQDIRCLIRSTTKKPNYFLSFDIVEGDLETFHLLNKPLNHVRTIIHLGASINTDDTTIYSTNVSGTKVLIDEAVKAGVEKIVFMSSDGVRRDFKGAYENSKLKGEEIITKSGIKYTIFRPGMVYGPRGHGFVETTIKNIRKYPLIPVVGDGNYKKQPVYVSDVISAIISCVSNSATDKKIYELGGATAVSFNEIIDTICDILNKRRIKLRIPETILLILAKLGSPFLPGVMFSEMQIKHACRDSIIDYKEATHDFGFSPISFRQGMEYTLLQERNER